jgi:photosystem II stability/assembly factor-like uncharacterized protein
MSCWWPADGEQTCILRIVSHICNRGSKMQPRRTVLLAICIILFVYFEIHSCSHDEVAGPGDPNPPVESIILSATGVYFHNADIGYVTGSLGTLMVTTDAGTTWKGTVIDQGNFSDIQFANPLEGWLVGKDGALYETVDGGSAWAKSVSSGYPSEEDFSKLQIMSDRVCYLLGYHGVYKTEDGGANWLNNWLVAAPYRGAWGMSFVDESTGYILGSKYTDADPCILYRTTDGAATWSEVRGAKASVLRTVLTISFVDSITGWAGGGVIMKTADGGETWQTQLTTATVREFHFFNVQCGFAVGGRAILRTKNGGDTWEDVTPRDDRIADLRSVCFTDANNGWVVGRGKDVQRGDALYKHTIVLRTRDGGTTWKIMDFPYDCTDMQDVKESIGS